MKKYKLSQPYFDEETLDYVSSVIRTGMLVQGEENRKFEMEIGKFFDINSSNISLVSSGTAALHLALLALDIKPGDKVIVPNFTFPATSNVVEMIGADCILVDVSLDNYNIDTELLEKALIDDSKSKHIKAMIIVHEFGAPCNMDDIMRLSKTYDIRVIEDAACAFGTQYNGSYVGLTGDVGCFSLHPRKALTTGEGGIVVSKNQEIIDKINILKNHGITNIKGHIDFTMPGLNYRMTNFQAALGLKQIGLFKDWMFKRVVLQNKYRELLNDPKIKLPENQDGHSWQSFMILLSDEVNRDHLKKALLEAGIESNYGAYALSNLMYYKEKYPENPYIKGNGLRLYEKGLCLPLHQGLEVEDIEIISRELLKLI